MNGKLNYKVDLLPVELQSVKQLNMKRLVLSTFLTAFLAALFLGVGYFFYKFQAVQNELERLNLELSTVNSEAKQVREVKKLRQQLEAQTFELNVLINRKQNQMVLSVLSDINNSVPAEVWLNVIEFGGDKTGQEKQLATEQGSHTTGQPGPSGGIPQALPLTPQGILKGQNTLGNSNPSVLQGQASQPVSQDGQARENSVLNSSLKHVIIKGATNSVSAVGVFLYNLNQLPHFSRVDLIEMSKDEEKGVAVFYIDASLKGGGL